MAIIRFFCVLLMSIGFVNAYSQMQITFPVSRVVFQRDNQNTASFNVAGDYSVDVDRVDARLIPIQNGQGESTDWQNIPNVSKGNFNGVITGKGGWYRLEVRGYKNGDIIAETSLNRVGIGEVFLVAGQSNAEGQLSYPGAEIGTTEDRVSCVDFVEYLFNENLLPFSFSQLSDFTKVGPYNPVPWYWARLGERLCKRLNVPVLFYGSAVGGTSVLWWAQSANGIDLRQQLPLFVKVAGMPYRGIQGTLQHYASRTGIRAILWHQGESDITMSSQNYFNNLKTIIDKSRRDVEHENLPWVVARVGNIGGQNQIANQVANVYQGPNTDERIPDIPQFRFNGHFAYEGLNVAANIWSDALSDYFFSNTIPKKPTLLLPLSVGCSDNKLSEVELKTVTGLNNYWWTDNSFAQSRIVKNGTYACRAQNNNGFAFFTQPITVNTEELQEPQVRVLGNSRICLGDSVSLATNKVFSSYSWNTGATSQIISVKQSSTYSVRVRNLYGCQSNQVSSSINFLPTPLVKIVASGIDSFCEGNSLKLLANSSDFSVYNWNTGETTREITVREAGLYTLSVKNANGCESPRDTLKTSFVPSPIASISALNDINVFCKGDSLVLSANNANEYFWSNGTDNQQAIIRKAGNYSLRIKDSKNCFSKPVSIDVFEKDKPPTPLVTISGAFQLDAKSLANIEGVSEQFFNWRKDGQLLSETTSTLKVATTSDIQARQVVRYRLPNNKELFCNSAYSSAVNLFIPYLDAGMRIHPNPSQTGIFNIETISEVSNASVTVFTTNGKLVFSGLIGDLKQKRQLDLSLLESGMYVVRLQSSVFSGSDTVIISK